MRHFDISSAFNNKEYEPEQFVYARKMLLSNGKFEFPGFPYSIMKMNLYRSKPACHINSTGLYSHLSSTSYMKSEADPRVYFKVRIADIEIISVTIDDLFITDTTNTDPINYINTNRPNTPPETSDYPQIS